MTDHAAIPEGSTFSSSSAPAGGEDRDAFILPVKRARAYDILAARIRDRIVSGNLAAGARLPSETALAADAEVSRSTVREALRVLQEGGFIERLSPKVMVVSAHTDEPAFNELSQAMQRRNVTFHNLYEALLVIEPQLASLAAQRATDDDIRLLDANLAEQKKELADFGKWNRLDDDFHLAIAEISRNPALVIARTPITRFGLPTLQKFMRSTSLTSAALEFHHRILNELKARDPEAAAVMARKHVNDFKYAWERAGLDLDAPIGEATPGPLSGSGRAATAERKDRIG